MSSCVGDCDNCSVSIQGKPAVSNTWAYEWCCFWFWWNMQWAGYLGQCTVHLTDFACILSFGWISVAWYTRSLPATFVPCDVFCSSNCGLKISRHVWYVVCKNKQGVGVYSIWSFSLQVQTGTLCRPAFLITCWSIPTKLSGKVLSVGWQKLAQVSVAVRCDSLVWHKTTIFCFKNAFSGMLP